MGIKQLLTIENILDLNSEPCKNSECDALTTGNVQTGLNKVSPPIAAKTVIIKPLKASS